MRICTDEKCKRALNDCVKQRRIKINDQTLQMKTETYDIQIRHKQTLRVPLQYRLCALACRALLYEHIALLLGNLKAINKIDCIKVHTYLQHLSIEDEFKCTV